MKIKLIFLLGMSLTVLASCGGGGGDGGGSSSDGGSATGVRVMHAAIDAAPVELRSSLAPGTVFQTVRFVQPIRYAGLPKGEQVIDLTRARISSGSAAATTTINYQGGSTSILLYGSIEDGGLRTATLGDSKPDTSGGAAVRIVNGLQNAPALSVNFAGTSTAAASYGTAGEYLITTPGTYDFSIASGATVVDSGTISIESGKSYSVLIAGRMFYYAASSVYQD